jgi:hypothetical protein
MATGPIVKVRNPRENKILRVFRYSLAACVDNIVVDHMSDGYRQFTYGMVERKGVIFRQIELLSLGEAWALSEN